ncbi:methyltransferase domain-containing protein [Roseomonas nepalensis]|uniref:Methyltransferase domain-containing protein n=1 Tax=Muricoccus nepalensis TaxID=1854500 RepID=A0A502FWP0_9PROT|nr:methyltransferase domain-containing protein [Roseomonas nepalensis]TPG53353.1 methyltransferase domain-containing protein [Roseomonas nepalensis]
MPNRRPLGLALALVLLSSCGEAQEAAPVAPLGPAGLAASRFPAPVRPVAPVVSDRWEAEDARERVGEAERVLGWLGVAPGQSVADIGAGSGYYTVRLAQRVGPGGRVLAQDVVPRYLARLRERVAGLPNVLVGLGEPGDPRLPAASTDVAILVHMYHEIEQPYALLANLVPALRPGARVGIVDVDDATPRHGTPRALLACELAAVGYREVAFHWLLERAPRSEYLAVFEAPAAPPVPESVRPCTP